MADILLTCSQCGNETMVSEHTDAKSVRCRSCDAMIMVPKRKVEESQDKPTKLKLRDRERPAAPQPTMPATELSRRKSVKDTGKVEHALGAQAAEDAHQMPSLAATPKPFLGWIVFVVVLLGAVASQYYIAQNRGYLDYYGWGRIGFAAVGILPLIVTAWIESAFLGALCLVIPPYTIFYALNNLDTYWMRGLFFAFLFAMGSEYFIFKDAGLQQHSYISIAQTWADNVIAGGAGTIERTANEPLTSF